ncbi:hypothetical protein BC826DRAFT_1177034 [Russula brevipes]|nr:hypothetical protein BC826DRAFT_1177034 [Russula brevipes]
MKLFAIASVFALSSILVSGSAIHLERRGPVSICGEGSELLDETSVSHDGKAILGPTKRDTTVSKRSAINIDKRQNICTNGACTVQCSTTALPSASDCAALVKYIASYAPGKLTLGSAEIKSWTSGTCRIEVANYDAVPYTICYETIAFDAALAANTCGTTVESACAGSGPPGDFYAVAIFSV